eukprot:GHVR01157501.1.p1 GENE.GHVR01157501.1~~GHVR01157501.1.p1  ORF type:complete len:208 (+),score=-18.05 GHVR01157501.1:283-906(+)
MLWLSIALSIIFILLCKAFPKCVVYSMIVLTFLVYIALIIVGIVVKSYALSAVFGVILLLNICILYCYWEYIEVGIVLIKVSGDFITAKPSIYFIAGISLLINLIFEIIWIFAWLGIYSKISKSSDDSVWPIISYVWYAMGIFFGFFLYYCMVFLIAMAVAFWYYQQDQSVLHGFTFLRKHIGSITFGAIVITLIKIARQLAQQEAG